MDKIGIISNLSGSFLAKKIARKIGGNLIKVDISKFANGEKRIRIIGKTNYKKVAAILPITPPVDENIIESLLIINALEIGGAKEIIVVIPWMGYSLQNKVFVKGEPLSVKVVASLFNSESIKKIILLDIHKKASMKYFKRPVVNIPTTNLFIKEIVNRFHDKNLAIASTDVGGQPVSKSIAKALSLPHISTYKVRNKTTGNVKITKVIGNVLGKNIILIDDGILTGGTLFKITQKLYSLGASKIHFMATHAVFTAEAIANINKSNLNSFTTTNSVKNIEYPNRCKIIDCTDLLIEEISFK